MRFSYSDRKGTKTNRAADPHAVLVLSPVWYMIGYDPDKAAFRHFRFDRIASATVMQETFRRRTLTIDDGECPFFFSESEESDQARNFE